MKVWQHDILPMFVCVHYWLCQLWILPTFGSVYLGLCSWRTFSIWDHAHLAFCSSGCLALWILSSCESCHKTFCPPRIVFTIGSVNSGFCSRLVMSSWGTVHLGECLLGICPLGNLASCLSSHVALFPLLVLSSLDCAHFWFCLLRSLSIWVFFYLDSVHFGVWQHDILLT